MAIGKWISFGAAQNPTASAPAVVEHPHVISAADAKQFGFENFGNTCCSRRRRVEGGLRNEDALILDLASSRCPSFIAGCAMPTPSYKRSTSADHSGSSSSSTQTPPFQMFPSSHPPSPAARARTDHPATDTPPKTRAQVLPIRFWISPLPCHEYELEPLVGRPNSPSAIPIPPAPPTLFSALRSLFIHISKNPADKGTVAPRAFIDKLKELNELFRSSMHQDAHEFLNYLLNRIMEEMEEERKNLSVVSTSIATLSSTTAPPTTIASVSTNQPSYHSTLVHRLFEGILTSETRCLTCETVSSRDESFLDLSIDIEQNSSVTACLRQFSASEMLCQRNKFFCDSCCDLQEAEKRMKIKKLPNVLALHLKRFKYQEDVGKYIKLAYRVAFPLELRLFNTVDDAEDPDRLYELFAIVVHIGNGPHHGHYVTIIKARGAWMLFDDDTVDTIKESEIPKYFGESNSGSAYVLYYQAVDLDMVALGLRPPAPEPSTTDIGSAPAKAPAVVTEPGEHEPGSPAVPPGLTEELDYSDKSESPMPATPASQPFPQSRRSNPPAHLPRPRITIARLRRDLPFSAALSLDSHPRQREWVGEQKEPVRVCRLACTAAAHLAVHPPAPDGAVDVSEHKSQLSPPPRLSVRALLPAAEAAASAKRHGEGERPGAQAERVVQAQERARRKLVQRDALVLLVGTARRRPGSPLPASPNTDAPSSHALAATTSHPEFDGAPSPPMPPPLGHSVPEHKKSTPDLSRGRVGKRSSALARLPRRPSTANATLSTPPRSRPNSGVLPPLPPLPSSPQSPAPNTNGSPLGSPVDAVKGKERAEPQPSPASTSSTDASASHLHRSESSVPFAPSAHGAVGLGFSTSYGSTASGSVAESPVVHVHHSAGANWKRATRKLSFTAPILGFGRKDRERHKDKDKDKDAQSPPTAFASARER
ncbi:Ubiquitin carboxyl-terminal hydrolase 4 [Grifola frondosa]|uniref:ubiquitinyl hydrolase 1 n=1 Tax=Grifola frondosa TaxID=5627 RepID=A0A1C7LMM6_GRIFR|nr:Ubiquitin carboxyl-terminal hydrolase 4 [Grifola frondosa]